MLQKRGSDAHVLLIENIYNTFPFAFCRLPFVIKAFEESSLKLRNADEMQNVDKFHRPLNRIKIHSRISLSLNLFTDWHAIIKSRCKFMS